MDHNHQSRRGHHHRGRRGPDRRGPDRRPQQAGDRPERQERQERPEGAGPRVDVEQIMRDIRSRISQRSGIELSNQQIEELAARRLEAILDPRAVKPSLLDQLRRTAAERTPTADTVASTAPPPFEEESLYDSRNGLLRACRRLLNPLLRLFINPTPIAHALALQAAHAAELRAHAAEQDRRQAEWNALQYEILQRLVTEVARVSLEAQALALKVDALTGRVDFADHRVRTLEGSPAPARPSAPRPEPHMAPASEAGTEVRSTASDAGGSTTTAFDAGTGAEGGPRRRRRRRRGRRAPGAGIGPLQHEGGPHPPDGPGDDADGDDDMGADDQGPIDSSVSAGPSEGPAADDAPPPPPPTSTDTESQ